MIKKFFLVFSFVTLIVLPALSVDTSLMINYTFNNKTNTTDSIQDDSGNGYNAKLNGSAAIKKLGKYSLLKIGSTNGYVDMGAKTGRVISTLSNFTVSTYLYIDPSVVLTNAGNFVWTFSNSADINASATGCMFFSAKETRYAICTTNYTNEKSVSMAATATKGEWIHVTYTQSGNTGTVYVDGVSKKTGSNISTKPTTLGSTSYNYLCKSAYASDQLLLNSMLYDFRVYNRALTATEVAALATKTASLDTLTFTDQVQTAGDSIYLGNLKAVTANLTLPATGLNSATITWSSSNASIVSNTGVVTRPANGADTARVVLTATITRGFISKTKTFNVSVVPYLTDAASVKLDADSLKISGNINNLRSNLSLVGSGSQGTTITWASGNTAILSNSGVIVSRPAKGSGKAKITLTATVTKGTSSAIKSFDVYVAEDEGFAAYLFAYFTGNSIAQEAIRFGISSDGLVYKALNNDNPVVSSAAISLTGGVRDPHILRGQNGDYYMVATDMVSANGWNSNRGIVLLKSTNLIDWTSATVNIPTAFPATFGDIDRAWAPETIYDPVAGKYLIYFSMRHGSGDYDRIYYAYANSTFTALESAPQVLFDNGLSTIDADIIVKDGVYNMFFKTEGNGNGIKKATSPTLTGTYTLFDKYLDQNSNAVEGDCVFKLINSDTYYLIYDVYSSGYYEFAQSTDLENFSVVSGMAMDFTPRHGTIIPITAAELQALNAKWGTLAAVDKTSSAHFSFYPNPASDVIRLNLTNSGMNARVSIYDTTGKMMLSKNAAQENEDIDVSNLSKGIYLLRYTDNAGVEETRRFAVK